MGSANAKHVNEPGIAKGWWYVACEARCRYAEVR